MASGTLTLGNLTATNGKTRDGFNNPMHFVVLTALERFKTAFHTCTDRVILALVTRSMETPKKEVSCQPCNMLLTTNNMGSGSIADKRARGTAR
jgi:hypothetical protein